MGFRGRRPAMRQEKKIAAFRIVEPKRPGDVKQERFGNLDVAALFEPGIPGKTDAGEQGNFLAPQSGRAATTRDRQADIDGCQFCSVVNQKIGKIAARTRKGSTGQAVALSNRIISNIVTG